MMALGIALLFISILAILYFSRAHERIFLNRKLRHRPDKPLRKSMPFHAVTILCGDRACEAARSCAGIKYLSSEAPTLPLAACRAPTCTCRYEHCDDRREDEERRSFFGSRNGPLGRADNRSQDRRGFKGGSPSDSAQK